MTATDRSHAAKTASPDDWRSRHAAKICTAGEAVRSIPRGRCIFIGSGAAEPAELVAALVTDGGHLADNQVVHILTLGPAPYVRPDMQGRFRHTAFFIGENVREAVQQGRADFMPVFLSDVPRLFRSGRVRVEVALIQVTPPDRHGYVSLGVSVDVVRAAVDTAALILAEVNPRMPRTHGDSFLHVDQIARLVPVEYDIPERTASVPNEVARAIGAHVANLVPDGATLQAGIGGIPNAVMDALSSHSDLGIHTEMLSDGVMRLIDRGVATGAKKTLLPGKAVSSFVMGSRRLYEWVDHNPAVEMRPSEFTNDPMTIARNDDMVAINSALAIDLTGQVAADTLMGRFFSGIGGQVDFIRGAATSRRGRPIIALPATARGGEVSRIVATLGEGAGVVTSRGDVHFVVTEHGVADLWGKNIRQRAMALIEIAHPDVRGELLDAAKRRHYVFPDQRAPRAHYPWEEARVQTLFSGERVWIRPARMADEEGLQDLLYSLSDESVYRRFLSFKKRHPHQEMQDLVDLDYELNMGLVATIDREGHEYIIGMSRYDVDLATQLAEVAFAVRDEWQGRGVGTVLMQRMCEIARARGLAGFQASVLATNKPMLMVLYNSGLKFTSERTGDTYELVGRF